MHWPNDIDAKGEVRQQFHHVIDIVPTILEAAGLPEPTSVNGIAQKPIEGTAMNYTFDDADAEQVDGLVVYRQELPIVFLNARRTADRLRRLATDDVRVVLLDATAISSFDSTGFDAMIAVRDELQANGVELWTVNPSVRRAASVDEARIEDVALARRFHHLDVALAAFEQLDGDDK